MKLQISVAAAICAGVALMGGCAQYSEQKAFKEELPLTTERITAVVTRTGTEIEFDDRGGSYQQEFTLSGTTVDQQHVTYRSSEVKEFRAESPRFLPPGEISSYTKAAEVLMEGGRLVIFAPPGGSMGKEFIAGIDQGKNPLSVRRNLCIGVRVGSPPALDRRIGVFTMPIAEVVLHDANTLVRLVIEDVTQTPLRDIVTGMTPLSTQVAVPVDSILYVKVKRWDGIKTLAVSIGVVAATLGLVVGIIAATKQSCPFLYSFDGDHYVFDAEPLGGATTAGLARTDLSRMEHIKPVDGAYRALLRNEVNETQYVDKLQLMYCDHDSSFTPIADGEDYVVLIRSSVAPTAARDETGADLLPFFHSRDGIAWETHMLSYKGDPEDSTRHRLRFTFPKPSGASRATVILHGGTTLWGSTMIRVMYELRGNDVDHWYEDADRHGPLFFRTMRWLELEGLYTMPLYARRGDAWIERGTVFGGGPLIHETQTVSFPLGRFTGDSLELCLRPPKGFWSFDHIAVSYDAVTRMPLLPLVMTQAVDQDGGDVSGLLAEEDHRYYEMPTQRDEASITWASPPVSQGKQRTLFARTSGYYVLHLSKEGPGELETLSNFLRTPGEIARYSAQQYQVWRSVLRAQVQRVPH